MEYIDGAAASLGSGNETGLDADLEAFLQAQRIDRGAADLTIEAYRRDLRQFAEWLGGGLGSAIGAPKRETSDVAATTLADYLAHLTDGDESSGTSGLSPASIARKTSALRQFFKFCCLERGLADNPAERLRSPAARRKVPAHWSIEQVTRLLAAADAGLHHATPAARARDRAMVYLLYATGLRVSELVTLTPHQLDLPGRYLRVRGKGDKERIAPFAPVAERILREYLDEQRPRLAVAGSEALFPGRGGERALTRQAFWRTLKDLAQQAGLPVALSPHQLRHAFATHLLASGMNLRSLQLLLGHADLATTQIYTQVAPEHLKSAHKRFHPRG